MSSPSFAILVLLGFSNLVKSLTFRPPSSNWPLILDISYYHTCLISISYPNLVSNSTIKINSDFVAIISQNHARFNSVTGRKKHNEFHFTKSHRQCTLLILINPTVSDLYEEIRGILGYHNSYGWKDKTNIIIFLENEGIFKLRDFKFRNKWASNMFDNQIYFVFYKDNHISDLYFYCYFCTEKNSPILHLSNRPSINLDQRVESYYRQKTSGYNADKVITFGSCQFASSPTYNETECIAARELVPLLAEKFNFTDFRFPGYYSYRDWWRKQKPGRKYYAPSLIWESTFDQVSAAVDVLFFTMHIENYGAFYCQEEVKLRGSQWHKWVQPFAPATWGVMVLFLTSGIVTLRLTAIAKNLVYKVHTKFQMCDLVSTSLTCWPWCLGRGSQPVTF